MANNLMKTPSKNMADYWSPNDAPARCRHYARKGVGCISFRVSLLGILSIYTFSIPVERVL